MKTDTNETLVYYTSAYEERIIKALCAVMLATFVMVRLFVVYPLPAIGMVIIHGYILGMIGSYSVYGVTCPGRQKWIYNGARVLLFVVLAVLNRHIEMYVMTACSLLEILGWFIGNRLAHGEFSGDNAPFRNADYDPT